VSSIDPAGSGTLKKVVTEFKGIDIAVYTAGVLGKILILPTKKGYITMK
jgi:hypothetical protein